MTGRDRTCDAPRFRRALYRAELRSREMGGAGVEPAASSESERRAPPRAPPYLLAPRVPDAALSVRSAVSVASRGRRPAPPAGSRRRSGTRGGRGWARTSSLLFVRQALSLLSYSPVRQIRDKGSNLDLHVQSVASCRLDDPGTNGRPPPTAPAGQSRNATCRIARAPCSVFITTRCQPCSTTVA